MENPFKLGQQVIDTKHYDIHLIVQIEADEYPDFTTYICSDGLEFTYAQILPARLNELGDYIGEHYSYKPNSDYTVFKRDISDLTKSGNSPYLAIELVGGSYEVSLYGNALGTDPNITKEIERAYFFAKVITHCIKD